MSRLLGIDHGRRRIGVAVADTETGIAFERPAIRVAGKGRPSASPPAAAAAAVVEVAASEGARRVVVGLPRNMDGSEGPQAGEARAFGASLSARGLEVTFVDERLTSWEAEQRLGRPRTRRARATGELDSAAARLILQDYLDARVPNPAPTPRSADPHDQEVG